MPVSSTSAPTTIFNKHFIQYQMDTMRNFNTVTFVLLLAAIIASCKKSEVPKEEEPTFPTILNGTIDNILFQNIDRGYRGSPHELRVIGTDGRAYEFTFFYANGGTDIGNGTIIYDVPNSTMTFDSASILLPDSKIENSVRYASTL